VPTFPATERGAQLAVDEPVKQQVLQAERRTGTAVVKRLAVRGRRVLGVPEDPVVPGGARVDRAVLDELGIAVRQRQEEQA
jgi:hypothetical protein